MRILMIISEMPPMKTGMARAGEQLLEGLRARGHEVDVVSTDQIPRLVRGEARLTSMLWKWPSLFGRLGDYDVIHLHGPIPTLSDIFLSLTKLMDVQRLKPPIIYTHHSEIDLPAIAPLCDLYNRFHKAIASLADHVVVTSSSYAQMLASLELWCNYASRCTSPFNPRLGKQRRKAQGCRCAEERIPRNQNGQGYNLDYDCQTKHKGWLF
jgi:glycosyltransferase involved in cell wall biosynthesis